MVGRSATIADTRFVQGSSSSPVRIDTGTIARRAPSGSASCSIRYSRSAPVQIAMTRGGTVRGRVVDADGRPLAGIPLASDGSNWRPVTDARGGFELLGVPPGKRLVYVENAKRTPSVVIDVTADKPVEGVSLTVRDRGVIAADVSIVSPEAVGRRLTMIVQVILERERPDLIDAFKRSMRATPEVMQCYYVTGETDFVLILTVKDMPDYEDFTRRFFFENPNVMRFNTTMVMDRVKAGLQVPVDDIEAASR